MKRLIALSFLFTIGFSTISTANTFSNDSNITEFVGEGDKDKDKKSCKKKCKKKGSCAKEEKKSEKKSCCKKSKSCKKKEEK